MTRYSLHGLEEEVFPPKKWLRRSPITASSDNPTCAAASKTRTTRRSPAREFPGAPLWIRSSKFPRSTPCALSSNKQLSLSGALRNESAQKFNNTSSSSDYPGLGNRPASRASTAQAPSRPSIIPIFGASGSIRFNSPPSSTDSFQFIEIPPR